MGGPCQPTARPLGADSVGRPIFARRGPIIRIQAQASRTPGSYRGRGGLATHLLEWLPFRPRRFVQGRVKRHTTGRRIAATGHCRAAYEFTCCMRVLKVLLIVASLACSACGTTGGALEEPEPVLAVEVPSVSQETPERPKDTEGVEGEVPLAVAESERPETATSGNALEAPAVSPFP